MRILRAAEGARPMLMGFDSAEDAGALRRRDHRLGIMPVAIEYMDRPAIKVCEAFAHAGYPLDVEALLIVEVEGSEAEIDDLIGRITAIAEQLPSADHARVEVGGGERRDLEGPQGRLRRHGPDLATISAWTASSRPDACRRC